MPLSSGSRRGRVLTDPVQTETAESGYKGVTAVRLPVPGFRARDGQKMLGTYDTRIEAAVMFARSRLCAREEKHHARKDDRRLGKKRKTGVEQEKPELAAANTHAAADLHYDHAEASRYTARNAQIQDELASRCLELLHRGEGNVAKHQLLLDLGCGSGLSGRMMEAVGHTWLGIGSLSLHAQMCASARRSARILHLPHLMQFLIFPVAHTQTSPMRCSRLPLLVNPRHARDSSRAILPCFLCKRVQGLMVRSVCPRSNGSAKAAGQGAAAAQSSVAQNLVLGLLRLTQAQTSRETEAAER